MKVFVSFGYNDRDRWVRELVFPILRAFGHEIETGEDLAGQPISDGVASRIDRSQAMIGFVTRRGEPEEGIWRTHRWVTDELARANANKLLTLEVRETGVDPQGGIIENRQHLIYDESRRDFFIVDLVRALGAWPREQVRLQLIGNDVERLVPLLRRSEFHCIYRFHQNGEDTAAKPARILPIKGGLFIDVQDLPPGALIQVEIDYQGRTWSSQFESLEAYNIRILEG